MRILFINSVVDYGSTGKIVRDLANGLIKQGHEVKIAYGRNEVVDSADLINLNDKWSSAWHLLMTRLLGRHGLHSAKATAKLIAEIERFNPEVIHLHNLHGYYLHVEKLLKYLKTRDCRIFLTLHDCWLFSGSSAYFDYHGCKLWDEGCVMCNSTKDYPQQLFSVRQTKNFKWKKEALSGFKDLRIITPSDWLKDLTSQSFLNVYPIVTINNGIDLQSFKPELSHELPGIKEDDMVYLGLASVWEKRKGLDYLYDLATKLDNKHKMVIIGLNDKQLESCPKHVIGMKRTASFEELKKYYSRADVFLNPTLEDNFPTTNLESLACGTPVLTFDTGGSKEAIDEDTGWVIQKGDTEGFIKQALAISKKTPKCCEKCRERAERLYSKETMINAYICLFEA